MRGILAPALMTIVGAIGVTHIEAARDLYLAAYPDDPARRAVLDHCAAESPSFNRLSATDRVDCYATVTPHDWARAIAADYARHAPSTEHHIVPVRNAFAPSAAYHQAFKERSTD